MPAGPSDVAAAAVSAVRTFYDESDTDDYERLETGVDGTPVPARGVAVAAGRAGALGPDGLRAQGCCVSSEPLREPVKLERERLAGTLMTIAATNDDLTVADLSVHTLAVGTA